MKELKNKNILIGISGSIAAYKTCDIIRFLRKEGANIQAIMTESAKEFIGKTTIAALTNNEVIMVLRNTSELIMDVTAMNHEIII